MWTSSGHSNRLDPQFRAIIEACRKAHCNVVLAEKNFSPTIAADLRRFCKERGAKVRIKETVRTSTQNKVAFIADTLEPLMAAGRLYIHQDAFWDFKAELESFPRGSKDDRLDATAGAINELMPTRVDLSKTDFLNKQSPNRTPAVTAANTYKPGQGVRAA